MNTVNSPEELDALPSGSVIRSATGALFEKKDDLWYVSSANMNQAKENGKFPSVILHNPESSTLSPHDTTIANQARRIDMLETGHRLAVDQDADMFESEVRKLIHSRIGANNVSSEQCKAIASAMRTAGFVRLRQ